MKTIKPKNEIELQDIVQEHINKYGDNVDLNHIDISEVDDLSMLFKETNFNGDISKWNVDHVIYMSETFSKARKFNQPLAHWNVSKVENMDVMFGGAKNFNQDISNWKLGKPTQYKMFVNCPIREEFKPKFEPSKKQKPKFKL